MLVQELKNIELLIKQLLNLPTRRQDFSNRFNSDEASDHHDLFNLISIYNLLNNFSENHSFSLESFLNTGIIPKMYEEKTLIPVINEITESDYQSFYKYLMLALKNGDYSFDNANNVLISSEDLDASIPGIWLYRLSQASRRDSYDRVFFYNKNKPQRLKDKEHLLEYLRSTKTFLVELSTPNPNANYNNTFNSIKDEIELRNRGRKSVKVDDIMDMFTANTPPEYTSSLSKYRLSEDFWLIKKAERMGEDFYSLPIEKQEEILNSWIIRRVKCNEYSANETQKYTILIDAENQNLGISKPDKEEVLVGLFNLYINVLSSLDSDYSRFSMSNFKIKTYLDEQAQSDKCDRRTLDRLINECDKNVELLTNEALRILDDINRLDLIENFQVINAKRTRYNGIMDRIAEQKDHRARLESEKKEFNNVESIAFDNEKIMSLIKKATTNGRIYILDNELVIELYNKSLSDPVFKVTINLSKLIEFIEDVNLALDESFPQRKVS